jgi:FAD/FMN-containing dehydrogenase
VGWTKETFDAVRPHVSTRRYVGYFSGDDTGEERARAAYGSNYERLRQVKAAYDPENCFRHNTNVPPA